MKQLITIGFLLLSVSILSFAEEDEKFKAKKDEWMRGEIKQQRQEDETHKRKHQTRPPQITPDSLQSKKRSPHLIVFSLR